MKRALLMLGLVGCSGRYVDIEVAARRLTDAPARVALAPAVVLAEVPGAVTDDAFRDGLFVGNLVFGGGFVTEQQDVGLQNVSKDVAQKSVDTYRRQAIDLTDEALEGALDHHGIAWTRLDPIDPARLPAPERAQERGTYADLGTDNTNLPRFALDPVGLPAEVLAVVPTGHDAVLVPYVVQYYSHNAGWFVGQTYGCAAGARYRVLVAAYDAASGRPIGWTDLTARYLHDRIFQPNSAQLEDFLIDTERALARSLRRNLDLE